MRQFSSFPLAVSLVLTSLVAMAAAPRSLYTDLGDGTVRDNKTGLIWQQKEQSPGCEALSMESAKACCSALTLGRFSSGWRLPSKLELETLVDVRATSSPVIDLVAFPGTIRTIYWTSTPHAGSTIFPWTVDFTTGKSDNAQSGHGVRCVHD